MLKSVNVLNINIKNTLKQTWFIYLICNSNKHMIFYIKTHERSGVWEYSEITIGYGRIRRYTIVNGNRFTPYTEHPI